MALNSSVCMKCKLPSLDGQRLPCEHSLCKKCLVSYTSNRTPRNIYNCPAPLCMEPFSMAEENVISVSSGNGKNSEKHKKTVKATKTDKYLMKQEDDLEVCVNCKVREPMLHSCVQCQGWLCGQCVLVHEEVCLFKSHTIVTKTKRRSEGDVRVPLQTAKGRLSRSGPIELGQSAGSRGDGEQRVLDIRDVKAKPRSKRSASVAVDNKASDQPTTSPSHCFCQDCKCIIPLSEMDTSHAEHSFTTVKKRAAQLKTEMDPVMNKVVQVESFLTQMNVKWNVAEDMQTEELKRTKEAIEKRRYAIFEAASAQSNVLLSLLERSYRRVTEAKKSTSNKLVNIQDKKMENDLMMQSTVKMVEKGEALVTETMDIVGDIEFNTPFWIENRLQTPNISVQEEVTYLFGDLCQEIRFEFPKPVEIAVFPSRPDGYKEERRFGDIVITDDGRIVVPDECMAKVKMFDQDGQLLLESPSGMFSGPHRVSRMPGRSDQVLVLDQKNSRTSTWTWNLINNTSQRFSDDVNKKRISLGSTHGASFCRSDSKDDDLEMTCTGSAPVDLSTTKFFYKKDASIQYISGNPCLPHVVINYSFQRLVALRDDELIWEIGIKDGHFPRVHGMCLLPSGHVVTTHYWDNTLMLISPDGKVKATILTRDDGLDGPHGVDYHEDLRLLAVVEQITGVIRLYRM